MSSHGNPPPAPDEFSWDGGQYQQARPRLFAPLSSGAATAALVLGIISLCFWPLGLIAVLCGHQGRAEIKREGMAGNGRAVAGLILGYITLAACCILIIIGLMGL